MGQQQQQKKNEYRFLSPKYFKLALMLKDIHCEKNYLFVGKHFYSISQDQVFAGI